MTEDMLTISEAVQRYKAQGLTDNMIRHWLKTKRLRKYTNEFDKTIAVKASDVEAVIASRNQFKEESE